MFTLEQIEEINRKLQLFGVKDKDLPILTEQLNGNEIITVVKDGRNVQLLISQLLDFDSFTTEQLESLRGPRGNDGKNAYQTWLSQGNVGTYDDYIAVLQLPALLAAETSTIRVNNKLNEADVVIEELNSLTNQTQDSLSEMNVAKDLAYETVTHPPVIINKYWHSWNHETNQYDTTYVKAEGDDAYEIWLSAGNEGTIEDYIVSLKGNTGNYGVVEFVVNENMELEQHTLIGDPLNFSLVDGDLVLTEDGETVNLGQVGQSSVPTYTDTIYRADAVYVNNHIRFKQTNLLCDVKSLVVRNSYGDITADAKIVYNGGYALIYSELLSKSANWEFFTIAYNLITNNKTYLPDLRGKIGRNYVQDEVAAGYHSDNNTNHFLSIYHQFGGTERQALKSQEIQNADISLDETDEWAVKAKFNIVGRPYVQGATAEEISSCPDILSIGSHWGNYYYTGAIAAGKHGVLNADPLINIGDRKDITENENTFLKNTIAITCGEKLDGTGLWCSYGYGVEFFEAMEGLVERYPEKNIYAARALMFSLDARTLTTTEHTGWVTRNNDQVGDKIYLHGETIQEAIITEIVDASTVKIDRDITIASPGVYMWNYCYLQNLTGTQPQQSATCSWVAAKLALIQDFTDANWQLVREAARMTASNSTMVETGGVKVYTTHWDMKRGFGMIDVTKAVEYIEDNYINNQEYKDSVIPSLPVYNPFLKVDDLDDNNPITKKQLLEALPPTPNPNEHIYSYDEKVIGEWVNGKPIYRKVFLLPDVYTYDGVSFIISHNIGIDVYIDYKLISPNGETIYSLYSIFADSLTFGFRIDMIPTDYHLILEYTKLP